MVAQMQVCSVFFRSGTVFVISDSQVDGGPYYAVGPMFKVKDLDRLTWGVRFWMR